MRRTLLSFGVVVLGLLPSIAHAQPSELVVLRPPGFDDAVVRKDIPFKTVGDRALCLDLYLPPDHDPAHPIPVVIFGNGVGEGDDDDPATALKEWGQYTSWPRLVTTLGFAGVSHNARRGAAGEDFRDLLDFLRASGASLGVDARNMCVWSCSANSTVITPIVLEAGRDGIRCAVLYYGGFGPNSAATPVRTDMPLLIMMAGLDPPDLNIAAVGYTFRAAMAAAPVELRMLAGAHHAFDVFDDNAYSRDAVRDTLEFMRKNLTGDVRAAFEETADWRRAHRPHVEASAAFREQRWADAVPLFERAIEADPQRPTLRANLASCHYNLGQFNEAKARWLEAGASDGFRTLALYNASCCAARAGLEDEALDLLARAIDAGFNDLAHVRADEDLASLRTSARFRELVGE